MPQASVIIPAYNAEATLAAAMASAQRQTLAAIEILVVDDASTDGTLAAAQRLAAGDLRVSVISGGRTRGPDGARNLGLSVAEAGSAACRARGCQSGLVWGGAVSLKKNN